MTPVDQTRFGLDGKDEAPGNCWQACVAAILDLPLAEVPDEAEDWKPGMRPRQSWIPYQKRVHRWLFSRGLVLIEAKTGSVCYAGPIELWKQTAVIMSGPSPRNPQVHHAVVAHGNEIVHDPHPSRAGLVGDANEWWYEFFVFTGHRPKLFLSAS